MGADAVASMLPVGPRGGWTVAARARRAGYRRRSRRARARLFEEVLRALEHLTRHSPVVLIIEDAHWADWSSRDLLTFLIATSGR